MVVIAGKERGKRGIIVRVMPRENLILLDRLNLSKRHRRPSSRNRKGQIVDRAMPLHVSNVMIADPKSGKPTRIKLTRSSEGKRERVAVKSGEVLK